MADKNIGSEQSYTEPTENAIYHEVSPTKVFIVKIFGLSVLFMVVIAFIIVLVKGAKDNAHFYLLACNLIMSSIVGIVAAWWYRRGDLSGDKYWFMLLVGTVIMFQCLTTDIYVFHVFPEEPKTTQAPTTLSILSTTPVNLTTTPLPMTIPHL